MRTERTTWRVYRRTDDRHSWVESVIECSEHNARGALEHYRAEFPLYEWELRKVTTIEERIEA